MTAKQPTTTNPPSTFAEERAFCERANMKRIKHLEERETLEAKGYESISSNGGRYKVWPKGKQDEAVYVSGDQLDELAALTPKEIGKSLTLITEAIARGVDTLKLSVSEVALIAPTKRARPQAEAGDDGEGKAEKKKKERAARPPRVAASAVADALLERINKSTDANPVIHSKLANKSEKKIARELWRSGKVQRVQREDGQLVYLPLNASAPKGGGDAKKAGAKKGAAKKSEAKLKQQPAVASKPARARRAARKPAAGRR